MSAAADFVIALNPATPQAPILQTSTASIHNPMPQDGVIFSDGVEADYLAFDSGAVASISVVEEKARLVAA
jgi:hypothetical protein